MIKIFIFLCYILYSSLTYAGTIDPNNTDKDYLGLGETYPYVVELAIKYENLKQLGTSSAVVYSPSRILTAAHVFEGSNSVSVIHDDKEILISKYIKYPKFDKTRHGYADIAVGFLKSPIHLKTYPVLYRGSDEPGKPCVMVGHGFTGTFVTGAKVFDRKRRAGTNYIDQIDRDVLICSPSKPLSNKYTNLEYLISYGDSGGGLFIDGQLAGIHSFVQATDGKSDSSYKDESCHTRISEFVDWINGVSSDEK
jgi:hypothetical protein